MERVLQGKMNQIYPHLFREIKHVHTSFNKVEKMTTSREQKQMVIEVEKREILIPARKGFRNVSNKSLEG